MHLKEKLDQLSEHPSDLNTCNYMHRKNINPETKLHISSAPKRTEMCSCYRVMLLLKRLDTC